MGRLFVPPGDGSIAVCVDSMVIGLSESLKSKRKRRRCWLGDMLAEGVPGKDIVFVRVL